MKPMMWLNLMTVVLILLLMVYFISYTYEDKEIFKLKYNNKVLVIMKW